MQNGHWNQENQDALRNKQERKMCYKELLDKVEAINEGECAGLQATQNIGEILREINALQSDDVKDRISHADETLLDSMVLSSASNVLVKCVKALDCFTSTYDPSEFAHRILQTVRDDLNDTISDNVVKLMPFAREIIPQVPNFNYVYGAYDLNLAPQPKQKKERVKRIKEQFAKKQPEKIVDVRKEEAGIEEIVKEFNEVLVYAYNRNGQQPIKYYDYVIDTEDFGRTVENMFYCSFLIRDGNAHITLNGRNEPYIKPIEQSKVKEYRQQGHKNYQMITAITMNEWQKFGRPGLIQLHRKQKS